MYVTDPRCTRVGTQCWVYGAIMVTEALVCFKFGRELFERTQATNIVLWLLLQMLASIACVYGCVLYHKESQVRLFYFIFFFFFSSVNSTITFMNS